MPDSTSTHPQQPKNLQQSKGAVKFVNVRKSQFFPVLKKRVDEYFKSKGLSRYGNTALVVKTIILLCVYLAPFICLLYFTPNWGISLVLWSLMGVGIAGLGMSVMHDGNHGSYSSNKTVNWLTGHVLNIMGGSTYNWKLQHNILHHTYTNITDLDDDIASKPALRLSPHAEPSPLHRSQWIHAFFLYGLTTLFWVTAKDFIQYAKYKKNKVSSASEKESRWILVKTILLKVVYFAVFFVSPIVIFNIPFVEVLTGFLVMHFFAGLILTVIFQLAHSLEGTSHPLPNAEGVLENDWAIHQMMTTMNFSPSNKLLSWYVGGLNYQVEHHLFPRTSHIHYPAISSIVKATAAEFDVPYLQHDTFSQAIKAHVQFLKKLGRLPSLEEAIG